MKAQGEETEGVDGVWVTFDEPSKTLICDGEIAVPFTNCIASFISPFNKVLKFRVGGKQASLLVGGTHERHGRLYTIEVKSSQVTSLTFMLPRSRTLVSLVTCAWELNADPKGCEWSAIFHDYKGPIPRSVKTTVTDVRPAPSNVNWSTGPGTTRR